MIPAGMGRTQLVHRIQLPPPRVRGTVAEVRGLPWLDPTCRELVAYDQLLHVHDPSTRLVGRHTTLPVAGRVCAVRVETGEVLVAHLGRVLLVQPHALRLATEEPLARCPACGGWRHLEAPCWECFPLAARYQP